MRRICFTLISLLFGFLSYSQVSHTLVTYENSLKMSFNSLNSNNDEASQISINKNIISLMDSALAMPESFIYRFDSLTKIGKILSPDKKFRLFSWNVPMTDGTQKYFCIIQMAPEKKGKDRLYHLEGLSGRTDKAEKAVLGSKNWYGALYYSIIPFKRNHKNSYILLGLDFNDYNTNRKIIDVLNFSTDSTITFGAPVFIIKNTSQCRIIFEYSKRASMSLNFDKKRQMLVFDHLSPSNPRYVGKFEYYGPDFSYDAFSLKDDKWIYTPDVIVKNEK